MPSAKAASASAGGNKGKGKKKSKSKSAAGSAAMVAHQPQNRASIPQTCKYDINQVLNDAGGYVWKLTTLEHVNRYLVLGGAKDMGNYYRQSSDVNLECALSVLKMIRDPDATQFVQLCALLKAVSVGGRAPKQEPVLLSLAAAIVFAKSPAEKQIAFETMKECVRIPTHMFMLAGFVRDLSMSKPEKKGKGWGAGFRKAVSHYYTSRNGRDLAFQMTKYQNREGWTHADIIRMVHIDPTTLADDGARLMFDYVMMKNSRKAKVPSEKTLATLKASGKLILPNPFKALTKEEFFAKLNSIETPPIPTQKTLAQFTTQTVAVAATAVKSLVGGFVAAVTSVMPSAAAAAAAPTTAPVATVAAAVADSDDDEEGGGGAKKNGKKHHHEQLTQLQQVAHLLKHLHAVHQAGEATNVALACALIRSGRLVREHIPTVLFGSREIWATLLETMPLEALLRNLGKMTQNGVVGDKYKEIVARMTDQTAILKARIHPIKVLVASKVYKNGYGDLGSLSWVPNHFISNAFTQLYQLSYGTITPTGQSIMVAVDVSGSMSSAVIGSKVLTCRDASIAMALLYLETEKNVSIVAFSDGLTDMSTPSRNQLRRGMTIDQALSATSGMSFSSTDCVLPILHAIKHNLKIDAFIVLTDNETYAPNEHPQSALVRYRQLMGTETKLIVIGMTGNCFTIVDPNDRKTLNLAGFDTSTPEIASMFLRGEI
uniref:TROVE domain-containing protein n=1 Tax=viral metagenome TaxID=1070528 RepID=A0A6C0I186_9ZZZZ